jgi:F5/8 type C domain
VVKVRLLLSVVLVCLAVAFLPSTAWAAAVVPSSCTADKVLASGYECTNVLSNTDSLPWASTNSTGVLTFDFGSATRLAGYGIVGRGAYSGAVSQAPRDWTVWASADGSTGWAQVDSQSGITWTAGQDRSFTIAAPISQRFYQFRFTANNGDSYLCIDYMHFDEQPAPTTTTTTTTAPATTTATVTATATATVTAVPTSVSLDSNQYGVLVLCGSIIMLGSVVTMIVGWRR